MKRRAAEVVTISADACGVALTGTSSPELNTIFSARPCGAALFKKPPPENA